MSGPYKEAEENIANFQGALSILTETQRNFVIKELEQIASNKKKWGINKRISEILGISPQAVSQLKQSTGWHLRRHQRGHGW